MNSLVKRFTLLAEEKQMVRPSELSFYDEPEPPRYEVKAREVGMLEQNISLVRKEMCSLSHQISEMGDQVNHVYETGVAHTKGAYNQLLDEENLPARIGVIAGGGLLGLMVGSLRGRLFKRLVYTGLGAGAGAGLCYPVEAAQLSEEAYTEVRKTSLIAYNFITGVEESGEKLVSKDSSMDLIASSMSRISRYSHNAITEIKGQLFPPPPPPSANTTSKEPEKVASKSEEPVVVFIEKAEKAASVEGDPGQGNPEDKDLYTTRSS